MMGSLNRQRRQQVLRRSKIFIAIATKIAISSVGAASNRAPQAGKGTFLRVHVEALQQLDIFLAEALTLGGDR
jgi:hypothetical protein